jgi:hypothetical protein
LQRQTRNFPVPKEGIPYEGEHLSDRRGAVTGWFLAHTDLSVCKRAEYGADLVDGSAQLVKPTIIMSAAVMRTNPPAISLILRQRAEERDAELTRAFLGKRTGKNHNGHAPEISDEDLLNMVRAAGVERTLEAAARIDAEMKPQPRPFSRRREPLFDPVP